MLPYRFCNCRRTTEAITRRQGASSSSNINDERKILDQDQHKCRKCGREVSIEKWISILTTYNRSSSGPTHRDSLQVLCTGCHRQKTFHPSKWSLGKDFTGRCDSLYVFQKCKNKIVGETTRRKLGYLEAGVCTMQRELPELRPNSRKRAHGEEYMQVMITSIDKICKAMGFSGIEDRTSELSTAERNKRAATREHYRLLLLKEALQNSRGRHSRCKPTSVCRKYTQ